MKIYLDNCSYNRPFDDQTYMKISLEAQAKLQIQADIKEGKYDLVWSYVMDYEAGNNPFEDRKQAILEWKGIATETVDDETEEILQQAEQLTSDGIKSYDALHIACAYSAGCEYFITTDSKLYRVKLPNMHIINPIQFVVDMEEKK